MARSTPPDGSITYGVDVPLVRLIEHRQRLAAGLGVLEQIEVRAICNSLQFRPAHGKQVLHVGGRLGVVGQFVGTVPSEAQILGPDPEVQVPLEPLLHPVLERDIRLFRHYKILHLHLLELPGPEGEVARRDLVAEGLPYLCYPETEAACAWS